MLISTSKNNVLNSKKENLNRQHDKPKFEISLFMGDKEISRDELKKYAIRSNTVDRIVNRVVDNAVLIDGNYYFVVPEE